MKPTILCVGSCITENVSRALLSQEPLAAHFDILFATANVPREQNEFPDEALRRCVLTIQDIGPWQQKTLLTEKEIAAMPSDTPMITIPGLHMSTMWPFLTNDPRNIPTPEFPWGQFPTGWTDQLALDVIAETPDVSQRYDAFMAKNPLDHINLQRFHEMQIVNMVMREEGYDVKIAAVVASRFRDQRLFFVYHHPSGELFDFILSQIIVSDKFRSVFRTSIASLIDGLGQWCRQSGVFTDEQMPIHPVVANQLDLKWWSPDMTYRLAGRVWTFEEWMRHYLTDNLPENSQ